MTGTWRLGTKAVRPGSYYRRSAIGITTESSTNGILACIFRSNFGTLNKVVDIDQTDMNNLEDLYGDGAAILREGLIGGATTIRAIRVGGDDGECSKVTLKSAATITRTVKLTNLVGDLPDIVAGEGMAVTSGDNTLTLTTDYTVADKKITVKSTAAEKVVDDTLTITKTQTPANAVEISTKYPGDRAFTVSVRTNIINDQRQVLIYDGTDIFDAVSFEASDDEAQSVVDAFALNKNFVARKLAAAPLEDITQTPMTGGSNPTVTNTHYSKGTDLLERFRWNCVVADTDDDGVQAMLISFVKQSYETGHLGMTCIAGKSTQDLDDRMKCSAAINDEKVVYLLNGWNGIDGTVYDGWLAAARIGGMIANVETNASLTHLVVSNALELIEPLTNGEITRAEQKGCFVLALNDEDQVIIDNAITTLVSLGNDMDEGWKKIRRTKCRFELMDRVNRTCEKIIGRLNNDDNGRATIVAAMQGIINEMVGEHKLFFGSYAEVDPVHAPEGDYAYFLLHLGDIDSLEKIYLDFRFSFTNPFPIED